MSTKWIHASSQAVGRGQKVVGFARFNLALLGERIRYARKLKRITQQGLAELVGVSRAAMERWEHGRVVPTLNNLAHIADVCDTTIPYLLGYEGYDEPLRVFTGEIPLRKTGKKDWERATEPRRARKG